MGDPETEVVLPRIESDLLPLLVAAAQKNLKGKTIDFISETATTVVAVSGGYPNHYNKGLTISGLDKTSKGILFHAGTKETEDTIVTNGGRVLASTGMGDSIQQALDQSYANLKNIDWDGINYRNDIGQDLLNL